MSSDLSLPPELAEKIEGLVSEREIRTLLLRCCRGIDRGDAALISACFHDDAQIDYGFLHGPASILWTSKPQNVATHYLANCLIDVMGDQATAESYVLACQVVVHNGVDHTRMRSARYLDRFDRRNGEWRISNRVLVDDWSRLDLISAAAVGVGKVRGARSLSDPSYSLLGLE